MEKYYCERCRLLYDSIEPCNICGELAEKKIFIEVQMQDNPNTMYPND